MAAMHGYPGTEARGNNQRLQGNKRLTDKAAETEGNETTAQRREEERTETTTK